MTRVAPVRFSPLWWWHLFGFMSISTITGVRIHAIALKTATMNISTGQTVAFFLSYFTHWALMFVQGHFAVVLFLSSFERWRDSPNKALHLARITQVVALIESVVVGVGFWIGIMPFRGKMPAPGYMLFSSVTVHGGTAVLMLIDLFVTHYRVCEHPKRELLACIVSVIAYLPVSAVCSAVSGHPPYRQMLWNGPLLTIASVCGLVATQVILYYFFFILVFRHWHHPTASEITSPDPVDGP